MILCLIRGEITADCSRILSGGNAKLGTNPGSLGLGVHITQYTVDSTVKPLFSLSQTASGNQEAPFFRPIDFTTVYSYKTTVCNYSRQRQTTNSACIGPPHNIKLSARWPLTAVATCHGKTQVSGSIIPLVFANVTKPRNWKIRSLNSSRRSDTSDVAA